MDDSTKRWMIFLLVAFVILSLFQMLNPPPPPKEETSPGTEQMPTDTPGSGISAVDDGTTKTLTPAPDAPRETLPEIPKEQGEEKVIETDYFRVVFNTVGAYPVSWEIIDPRYAKAAVEDVEEWEAAHPGREAPFEVGEPYPLKIIPDYPGQQNRDYPLMVVLKETAGAYINSVNRRNYTVEGPTETEDKIEIRFVSPLTREGLQLSKIYTFNKGSYLVNLKILLSNPAGENAQNFDFSESMQPGLGLIWGPGIGKERYSDRWDAMSYRASAFTGEEILDKAFKNWDDVLKGEMQEKLFEGSFEWGMLESRFLMANLIPEGIQSPLVRAVVNRQDVSPIMANSENIAHPITTEVYTPAFQLRPGDSKNFEFTIYVGPKQLSLLKRIDAQKDYGLSQVPFHNMIWLIRVLARFMLGILVWLYSWTANYGISIILLTIIMRLITQPLTHIGMKSQARVMAEQQRIKPIIDSIREKHKDDPQKMNSEIWKTYREHGVNPLGMMKGCVWMLIQLPIFFALYRLLMGAIDLRGESFLWINDLTAPDALFTFPFSLPILGNKFNILPILMGLSQLVAQRLQSTNMSDPNQKMMATAMPIIFIFILYNFPAGLSLYWFISNLWQIIFQVFVNKKVREEVEKKVHQKFEERQKTGFPAKDKSESKDPGWRDNFMKWLEKKAKDAEKTKKRK